MPHSMIADAHRQSVDVIAWHPAGHMVGTASHDCILKFWCREPPGSKWTVCDVVRATVLWRV
jgi:WD40 repeat protein